MSSIRISLNSKKYPGLYAVVDASDAEMVSQFRWYAKRSGHRFYAYCSVRDPHTGRQKSMSMHRVILDVDNPAIDVDHINGDGLDNRRSNIRRCNQSQNQMNRKRFNRQHSRYRGVTWNASSGKWQAAICKDGVRKYLGVFVHEDDAARAYNDAAESLFGDFASLNGQTS